MFPTQRAALSLLYTSLIPLVFHVPCHLTLPYSKFPFTQALNPVSYLFAFTPLTPRFLDRCAWLCLLLQSASPTSSSAWLLQLGFWKRSVRFTFQKRPHLGFWRQKIGDLVVTVWQHFLGTGKAFNTLTLFWQKSGMVCPDNFGGFMLFARNTKITAWIGTSG